MTYPTPPLDMVIVSTLFETGAAHNSVLANYVLFQELVAAATGTDSVIASIISAATENDNNEDYNPQTTIITTAITKHIFAPPIILSEKSFAPFAYTLSYAEIIFWLLMN